MLSYELRSMGFKEWLHFSLKAETELIDNLPEKTGVYVIRDRKEFGRFIKTSDIVYIGHAPKDTLKVRISKYFNPSKDQSTNIRINTWLKTYDSFQISWKEINNNQANDEGEKDTKKCEKELLNWYEQDHGELPPFNRQQ